MGIIEVLNGYINTFMGYSALDKLSIYYFAVNFMVFFLYVLNRILVYKKKRGVHFSIIAVFMVGGGMFGWFLGRIFFGETRGEWLIGLVGPVAAIVSLFIWFYFATLL